MTTLPVAPVDERTTSLLALIHGDRFHAADRQRVIEAIVETAAENFGEVDPNRLRLKLTDERGCSTVWPNIIGPVIASLRHHGALICTGHVVTKGSRSGNSGRLARKYELREVPRP